MSLADDGSTGVDLFAVDKVKDLATARPNPPAVVVSGARISQLAQRMDDLSDQIHAAVGLINDPTNRKIAMVLALLCDATATLAREVRDLRVGE